jgi:mRNA interferase MazF
MKEGSLSEGRCKDMAKSNNVFKRGDLVYAALGNYPGSRKQSGDRPCLVVSNDHNNTVSPIVTVCPLTTRIRRNPMHISIGAENVQGYFPKESEIMVEQITVLDRKNIISKYGYVKKELLEEVDTVLLKHLGLSRQVEGEAGDLP